jgi:hypothetical protein
MDGRSVGSVSVGAGAGAGGLRGRSASIVCEGACNPEIVRIDAAIGAVRSVEDGKARGLAGRTMSAARGVSPGTIQAMRRLRHTVHVETGAGWLCLACGHVRQYGAR